MEQGYKDETFLARWIANELTPEELKQFQSSEDYHHFKAINDASQQLKVPPYNKTAAFNTLKGETLEKKNTNKVRKLTPAWLYGAVASIALIISFFYFNANNTTSITTNYGEQITISLPDNSKVHLSPNSKLEYVEKDWNTNRNLSLAGEAYFEVEKGETFTVNTTEGSVTVLGTKFTVNSSKNFFETQCFEGKVKVTSKNNNEVILTRGKAHRIYNEHTESWDFDQDSPSWIHGESSFTNTPISQVIKALEKQYKIKFDTTNIDVNKRFTGTFTHKNMNVALKTVFAPMKISFTLAKNSPIVLRYN
ncbi:MULTISPECIES: FecR family protein [unclassified Tenacibaculum]|uniref:FecR family protein n=1 Tax=unclassified Tenacibaculum TaxID=2635139 RepID=UPI001F276C81|nr:MULTISPECIES: FecR family protein [unclassified Tenacibaculum]MCF2876348.1 FecR domain-containing protein [Tenacibaculum sp. Cn5-1]MCF2936509.1 FecR domain-containing protein [Tenacibaculum sp. Cn5-34]MCG7512766.1 FecR domain-containing protein [Tenacibaculum sp. Cn5-46]